MDANSRNLALWRKSWRESIVCAINMTWCTDALAEKRTPNFWYENFEQKDAAYNYMPVFRVIMYEIV